MPRMEVDFKFDGKIVDSPYGAAFLRGDHFSSIGLDAEMKPSWLPDFVGARGAGADYQLLTRGAMRYRT